MSTTSCERCEDFAADARKVLSQRCAPDERHCSRVPHLRAEIERLTAERDAIVADLAAAAGELMVPIPEPGTTASRMMLANVLMRRERDGARAELEEARLTLAAEQGRAEGAPSEGWESTITEWRNGRKRVRRQGWGWGWVLLEDPPSRRSIAAGVADTARAAMLAADASK